MSNPPLTGRLVVPISRSTFPLGKPVVIEGFIDAHCGWEFDAPLHFMRPFHRYHIVSSCCIETVDDKLEDLLLSLQLDREIKPDADAWPYPPDYLKRLWYRACRGESRFLWMYRSTVIVNDWGDGNGDGFEWSIVTEEAPTNG